MLCKITKKKKKLHEISNPEWKIQSDQSFQNGTNDSAFQLNVVSKELFSVPNNFGYWFQMN